MLSCLRSGRESAEPLHPWEKPKKKTKEEKGEIRVSSVLKQEQLDWSELTDLGITKLRETAKSAARTK